MTRHLSKAAAAAGGGGGKMDSDTQVIIDGVTAALDQATAAAAEAIRDPLGKGGPGGGGDGGDGGGGDDEDDESTEGGGGGGGDAGQKIAFMTRQIDELLTESGDVVRGGGGEADEGEDGEDGKEGGGRGEGNT
jgi:hypothetical protein